MNTLTLPALDSQLINLDSELAQLQEAIAQKKALRKAIANKKNLAIKAISKLETVLSKMAETFSELGESAEDLKVIASQKISEYFPKKVTEDNLVTFPKPKANGSNNFYTWQPTINPLVGSYFNVAKGKNQATYIGSGSKSRLKSLGTNLAEILPGISYENRPAERIHSTKDVKVKHELKIKGLTDDEIGWLTQFDFTQDFYPQFACTLKSLEIEPELKLTENNWIAAPGAVIKHNFFNYACYLAEKDNFGEGIAKDMQTGETFNIFLDDWHLDPEFQREIQFTWESLKVCKSKKALETVKNSDTIDELCVKFVWRNLPKSDRANLEKILNKEQKVS